MVVKKDREEKNIKTGEIISEKFPAKRMGKRNKAERKKDTMDSKKIALESSEKSKKIILKLILLLFGLFFL